MTGHVMLLLAIAVGLAWTALIVFFVFTAMTEDFDDGDL